MERCEIFPSIDFFFFFLQKQNFSWISCSQLWSNCSYREISHACDVADKGKIGTIVERRKNVRLWLEWVYREKYTENIHAGRPDRNFASLVCFIYMFYCTLCLASWLSLLLMLLLLLWTNSLLFVIFIEVFLFDLVFLLLLALLRWKMWLFEQFLLLRF